MKVTVLIENSAPAGLLREHGLSFHLEYEGGRYLLDAGECGAMLHNAIELGVELGEVQACALSHGHYDHGDGFGAFFAVNRTAPVLARPAAAQPRYRGESGIYNGVNPGLLTRHARRFSLEEGERELAPGLHLIPDSVGHEQSLVAETGEGLVVLNSCCHAGVGDILDGLRQRFPGKPFRAVLGGFHLMGSGGTNTLGPTEAEVRALARRLRDELDVAEIYTGHCTGTPAFALLAEELGPRLHRLTTGAVYHFAE